MQAWSLDSPFLIFFDNCHMFAELTLNTVYARLQRDSLMCYHLWLATYLFPEVSSKTNQKAEMPEVKVPFISTESHHSKRKIAYTCCKRSSRKHSLPGESWVDLNKPTKIRKTFFFFNRKLPSDTFLRKCFIPVLSMHRKKRGTHGCLLVITLFIFESKLCLTFE